MRVTALGRRTPAPVPIRTIAVLGGLALLLLGVIAALVGSQRHVPAPFGPAVNGSVAFVRPGPGYENQSGYHEPFGDIVAVDPATGTSSVLVGGPDLDGEPAWSLDGTRLAFVRQLDGGVALFVVDGRGGAPVRLTEGALASVREAAWSPDGRSIAFTSTRGTDSDLWIAAADGSGAHPLDLPISVVAPRWRPPDGRELLVVGSALPGVAALSGYDGMLHGVDDAEMASGLGLFLVDPKGARLRPVTSADGRAWDYGHTSFTPDGRTIVTQVSDTPFDYLRIQLLTDDGVEVGAIYPDGLSADALAPSVSPDGTQIAYGVLTQDQHWRIHVRGIDGGRETILDHEFTGAGAAFRWSPDAQEIVVNHHYFLQTWLLPVDGTTARQAGWMDPGYAAWQRTAP